MLNKTDLSGVWELFLDENMKEEIGGFRYNDTITLPNSTSNAGKGAPNPERETGYLTDAYKFEGNAWFSKKVTVSGLSGKTVKLFLERTRISEAFINGVSAGVQDSFCAPHVYDVTKLLREGENLIEVRVANKGYKTGGGHMTSPDTQSNWNGITGEISLRFFSESYAENVFVKSDIHKECLYVTADICGKACEKVTVSAEGINGNKQTFAPVEFPVKNGKLDACYPMTEAKLWSEFSPNLYALKIDVSGDVFETTVGLREFKGAGDKFTINGEKTFLRGKHDGLIFPKTGFAPTTVGEWLKVLEISKSYGINHYRFHTCCPPDAAFTAADMLGIYMEPQLPFWGTVTTPDDEKHNQEEQDFLVEEGFKMMKAFGNHPSFCMMSMGNELWGSKERINEIMGGYKKIDNRHLYTQGSNNFQWFPNVIENDDFFVGVRLAKDRLIRGSYAMCDAPLGHVQTDRPSTMHDYDDIIKPTSYASKESGSADGTVQIQYGTTMKTVKASEADAGFIPGIPVVTHEIGQYETFPNFNEIEKYTGPLKPRNLETFRETMKEKGLLDLSDKFFKASGKLAVSCYKEELEAALRSKNIAGFQILDIQDFSGQGTALVGVLDAFMDSKGLVTPENWRQFCSDCVILARFESYTLEEGDSFSAAVQTVNFSVKSLDKKKVKCTLASEAFAPLTLETEILDNGGNYLDVCEFSTVIPPLSKPCKAEFEISVEGTDIANSYTLWLYPKCEKVELDGCYIFEKLSREADELLEKGKTVLIVPDLEKLENSIEGFYCTDFWCYPMFCSISEMMKKPLPVGTMGLLIDNSHPALAKFPSEDYSTHQWWEIAQNSRSEILDGSDDKTVIVRTIDNFERCHSLGLLYEYSRRNGKVVVANCDFEKLSATPEGRQFITSVTDYCKN